MADNDYSKKELELIEYFGFSDLVGSYNILPPVMYEMMVQRAFTSNDQSEYAESLRKCFIALQTCFVNRGTKEWDDLIQFQYGDMEY